MMDVWGRTVDLLRGKQVKAPKTSYLKAKTFSVLEDNEEAVCFSTGLNWAKKFKRFCQWWRAKTKMVEDLFKADQLEKIMELRGWKQFPRSWWEDTSHLIHFAKKFKSAADWRRGHQQSYNAANRRNLTFVVAHAVGIKIRNQKWTWQAVMKSIEHAVFRCLKEWRMQFPCAYEFTRLNNKLDELFRLIEEKCKTKIRRYKARQASLALGPA